jgi:hypothetical protein
MQDIFFMIEDAEDGSFQASSAPASIQTETGITGLETPQR